jgi:GTPase SAR1 family protein
MDPIRNPFSPGAGNPPPELVGRFELLQRVQVSLARVRAGRYDKSLILIGLRGVGKTVLLNQIKQRADASGYKTILVEAHERKSLESLLLPPLRSVLFSLDSIKGNSDKVKRAFRVLRSFLNGVKAKVGEIQIELGVDPEVGTGDSGDLETDLAELLVAVADAAADRRTAVALCIDELQYLSVREFSALIMAIHRVSQQSLPLILIGAGLPQIIALAGRSKSYSERLFDFPEVDKLDPAGAKEAIRGPLQSEGVVIEESALDEIVRLTQGYPYFLQQWGYETWNLAESSPITKSEVEAATSAAIRNLDKNFFRVRFDRLTPRQKEYLRALALLGAGVHRSGDVSAKLGVESNSVGPVRDDLIKKGVIYSPRHGDVTFTVPLFDEFMLRAVLEA